MPLPQWPPQGELLQSPSLPHPHVPLLHALPFAALLQSPLLLHPQMPLLHWLPSGEAEQPEAHVPPEQQPPLHSAVALHEVVHLPALQAVPEGQSPGPLHPHVPETRHACPAEALAQSTQLAPDVAHAVAPIPVHCPLPLQQ